MILDADFVAQMIPHIQAVPTQQSFQQQTKMTSESRFQMPIFGGQLI